jgi:hypothetical protein
MRFFRKINFITKIEPFEKLGLAILSVIVLACIYFLLSAGAATSGACLAKRRGG